MLIKRWMVLVVVLALGCGSEKANECPGPDGGTPIPGSTGGAVGGGADAGGASMDALPPGGGTSTTGPIATAGVPSTGAGGTTGAGGGLAGAAGGASTVKTTTGAAGAAAGQTSTPKDAGVKDGGANDGSATAGNTGTNKDGGTGWSAANPNATCSLALPANAQPVDTTKPAAVIGDGTPASCTFAKLQAAAKAGGIITFACGDGPVTIPVTATLDLPITKDTVFDGGRKITLDGGGAVRIMRFYGTDYQKNNATLTLQHIALANGKATPTEAIPTRPAPCSQGYNDGQGGAVLVNDGNLVVIDSIFTNNQGAPLGPDTGGGAIYIMGSKNGVLIVGSTFIGNSASNAGAVGCLQASTTIYNSLFQNNKATGRDANNADDGTKCSYQNNGQYEIGSGGNGGAIYNDGQARDVMICGTHILNNAAGTNAFGGGVFFTSNDFGGVLSFIDSTMTGNTGGSWTIAKAGSVTNAGTAVGTNAKSITIQNSTLQGVK